MFVFTGSFRLEINSGLARMLLIIVISKNLCKFRSVLWAYRQPGVGKGARKRRGGPDDHYFSAIPKQFSDSILLKILNSFDKDSSLGLAALSCKFLGGGAMDGVLLLMIAGNDERSPRRSNGFRTLCFERGISSRVFFSLLCCKASVIQLNCSDVAFHFIWAALWPEEAEEERMESHKISQ